MRRRSVAVVAVLAAVSVLIGAMPVAQAQAQPASAASEATREAARRKLVEGVAAMKRGDYPASLARFEEAYALVPSPKIHYDFGLAYVGLGRSAEALTAFERFLAEAPDAPPDKREKAAALISELRARGAGETAARGDPGGAGNTPAGAQAIPPAARVDASLAALADLSDHRDDGATIAATPADPDPLRRRRIAAVSLGAVGVGLVAAGLVFGVLARGEGDSLTHDSQVATETRPTPFDPGKESRGVAYERLQIIGLVAGFVAGAAGAALYATSRRRVAVEPGAGHSLAGATFRLTF